MSEKTAGVGVSPTSQTSWVEGAGTDLGQVERGRVKSLSGPSHERDAALGILKNTENQSQEAQERLQISPQASITPLKAEQSKPIGAAVLPVLFKSGARRSLDTYEELRDAIMNKTSRQSEEFPAVQAKCMAYDRAKSDSKALPADKKKAATEFLTAMKKYQIASMEKHLLKGERSKDNIKFDNQLQHMINDIETEYSLKFQEDNVLINSILELKKTKEEYDSINTNPKALPFQKKKAATEFLTAMKKYQIASEEKHLLEETRSKPNAQLQRLANKIETEHQLKYPELDDKLGRVLDLKQKQELYDRVKKDKSATPSQKKQAAAEFLTAMKRDQIAAYEYQITGTSLRMSDAQHLQQIGFDLGLQQRIGDIEREYDSLVLPLGLDRRLERVTDLKQKKETYEVMKNQQGKYRPDQIKQAAERFLIAMKKEQIASQEEKLFETTTTSSQYDTQLQEVINSIKKEYTLSTDTQDRRLLDISELKKTRGIIDVLSKEENVSELDLIKNHIKLINLSERVSNYSDFHPDVKNNIAESIKHSISVLDKLSLVYIESIGNLEEKYSTKDKAVLSELAKIYASYFDASQAIDRAFQNVPGYSNLKALIKAQALQEFSPENCQYLEAVASYDKQLLQKPDMDSVIAQIEEINNQYVNVEKNPKANPEGVQVNISFGQRAHVNKKLDTLRTLKDQNDTEAFYQLAASIFDISKAEIVKLIKNDTFKRLYNENSNHLGSVIKESLKLAHASLT